MLEYVPKSSGIRRAPEEKDTPIYDGGGTVDNNALRKENIMEKNAASKAKRK